MNEKSYIQTEEYIDGPYMELIPKFDFEDAIPFSTLKANGLRSRLMGPQRIKGQVASFLLIEEERVKTYREVNQISTLSDDELEILASQHGSEPGNISSTLVTRFHRSSYISEYAKRRAKGYCQLCEQKAPFCDSNGKPYLESHHLIWLSRGGADTIDNVVALCPNCHKRMHIVCDPDDVIKLKSLLLGLDNNRK